MPTRKKFTFRPLLLLIFGVIVLSGCASQFGISTQPGQYSGSPGLLVRTHDEQHLFFKNDQWRLTLEGIAGRAEVTTTEGLHYTVDTTLSYWNTQSAEATGRNNTMGRFMLTVLGIILVLGLAGIILYAAFLATDR